MSDTTIVNGDISNDDTDDDLATLLAIREHARPNKATWVLLTLLVLVIGFVGGALANQKFGASSSSSPFPGLPSGFTPPGLSSGGFGPAGGGTTGTAAGNNGVAGSGLAGATFGTVKLVDGTNMYIATNNGATIKVKVPKTAAITAQKDIALSDLPPGSSVIVRGETGSDGTVTATSVSEATLPGVPPATQASPQPTTQGAN